MDHQALPPVDHPLFCTPDSAVSLLLEALDGDKRAPWLASPAPLTPPNPHPEGRLRVAELATALRDALARQPACLVRYPLSWSGGFWPVDHPLSMLGYDGGAGIGSGPGMLVGSALALRDGGRLPVGVLGDGDFLMGCTAFWTAARYGIPLLAVIANNRSFYNDEVHQQRVAELRTRNVANKWIGQHIGSPDVDLAAIARAQGCTGIGPVHDRNELGTALAHAVAAVQAGQPTVVDVRVEPGYGVEMQSALTGQGVGTAGARQ
jgi:thiamine pyrophosphate-dependent acetolactate synthase large subunit-like protein